MLNATPDFSNRPPIPVVAFELYNNRQEVVQTDWMTALTTKFDNDSDAIANIGKLLSYFNRTTLYRVKVKRPYDNSDNGLYIEAHYELPGAYSPPLDKFQIHVISRNMFTGEFMGTIRSYKRPFSEFISNHPDYKAEVCILDTNVSYDSKWIAPPYQLDLQS